MGVDKSLPEGQNSDAEMQELAKVISSDKFRNAQREFFQKYCDTFDYEEENKLEYTQIHKEYENIVEALMTEAIGEEKMQKIELGLNEYIRRDRKGNTQAEVLEAIEVLSSLGDFVKFKEVMLAMKTEMSGGGSSEALQILNKGLMPAMDVQVEMGKVEYLVKEASAEDGWTQVLNDPGVSAFTKTLDDGDKVLRCNCELELPPKHVYLMFTTTSDDILEWYTQLKKI